MLTKALVLVVMPAASSSSSSSSSRCSSIDGYACGCFTEERLQLLI